MKFLSDILAKAGLTVDGVVTLNNTATGQTPDANDNSTKLATTAWVRTFVQPYSLPIASASVLGGIKVGSGLSINSGTGVLSVVGASAASIKSTQTFVVTEGQTVYTVTGGYTPGLIDVFLNGVYLSPNQIVATNGTTFTINDPAVTGDIVDVIVASPIFEGSASTTDQLPEGVVNLYYTNARARAAITLTTTGVSGAATYNSSTGVFNIPNYQGLVPAGGLTGDILAKVSGTNYDVTWIPNYTSSVKHYVKLGETMTAGTPVYVSGSTGTSGTNMIVSKASNALESTSSKTIGLIATGGVTNDEVFVVTEGLISGLNTSTATANDPVWLGPNGTLLFGLANKPYAPAHLVFLGIVTRVQTNNGEIFVKVQNGFELDELHDLSVKNASDGDMIKYVASTGLWTKIAATTTNITEGTNLYYTDARVGTYLTANSYATQSYVSTQIANLVDSAPTTLDTLNELAAALGDDPNFATTVTNSIATKVPQSRTITINGVSYDLSADRSWSIAAGVTSFNTRTGAITLISGDVTGALGYTPYNSTNPNGYISSYTETDTLSTVTARGASTSTTLNLDGRVNIGNGLTRPSALNSDSVAHARIGGSDVHLYVASLGAGGGYKVAVQAARTSDFASFSLDLQSNGGTLLYGGNEIATRTWVTSQNYLTSYTETDTLSSVTGRGATTSSNLTFSGQLTLNKNGTQLKISRADTAAADWFFHSWASGINIYPNAAGTVYFGRDGSATNVDVYNGTLYQQGNAVWHAGNFSPSSYLPLSGGTMTGQLYAPSIGTGVYEGAIQIRETGYVGSGQSAWGYAPAITFHWGNRTVKKFGIRFDGLFAVDDEPLALRSWVTSQSYLTSITSSNVITALGYTPATDSHNHDLIRYSLRAPNNIDSMSSSDFRSYVFGSSANGHTISTARWNSVPSGLSGMNMYGTLFAWAGSDTHGFIATDYSTANVQVGGGNGNAINWKVSLIHSSNIGSQSVAYASSAGSANSVSWNNVSGRPSALSQFSNDSGYITSSGSISGSAAQFAGYGIGSFEGNFATTIDASGLSASNYYPVTISVPANRLVKLSVRTALNSNVPSWATHPSGFSVKLIWYTNGNGWGTNDTIRYIESYNYRFVSGMAPIGGVSQLSNSSEEVVWVRGGGVYYCYGSEPLTWTLRTSNYDNYGPPYTQTAAVTSSTVNDVWGTSNGRVSFGEVYSPGSIIAGYRLQTPDFTLGYWDGTNNRIESGSGRPMLITSYGSEIRLGLSGSTHMTVTGSGVYSSKFFVNGDSWIVFNNEEGAWGIKTRTTTNTGNLGSSLKNIIYCGGGSNEGFAVIGSGTGNASFEVKNDGTAWIKGTLTAGGDVVAYSDERVKTNILTITNALSKTLQLRGVVYNRTDLDDNSDKIGIIAQEIQKVVPEVVIEQPTGLLGVSYGNLSALFIEAIKEQQTQIESQKSEIEELKDLVKQLINR